MIQEHSEVMFNDLSEVTPHVPLRREHYHYAPRDTRDKIAKKLVHLSAEAASFLFQTRYNHRAVVLETIASVPGMVGGLFQHLKSLRFIRDDNGWIRALLDEAENERIHLLVYSEIAKPTTLERALIIIVQFFFCIIYGFLYLISPKTGHRVVGYFEEEAIHSYERYLELVHQGVHENIPATTLAKNYWKLKDDARLTDMIEATIADEMLHRDVNHRFADDKNGTRMWH
jgi:ubiquinol oxidase